MVLAIYGAGAGKISDKVFKKINHHRGFSTFHFVVLKKD